MSMLSYFIKNEKIAAIHITENAVSAARFTRKTNRLPDIFLARVSLPEGTIRNGRVQNINVLIKSLRELRVRIQGTSYIIASIPHPAIFTKTTSFPRNLSETLTKERIDEAARMSLAWNNPFPKEKSYVDTDIIMGTFSGAKISAVETSDINPYLNALEKSGFYVIAIESEHAAIARTIDPSQFVVTILERETYTDISVYREDMPVFTASYPKNAFKAKTALTNEIKRVSEFVSSQFDKKPTYKPFEKLPFLEEVRNVLEARNDTSLSPLLGTLLRAKIPRKDDSLSSLMNIGTEQAYAYKKMEAFTGFLGSIALGAGLVLFIASLGVFTFTQQYYQSLQEGGSFSIEPSYREALKERRAAYDQFNETVRIGSSIASKEYAYADIVSLIRKYAIQGIVIRNVSLGTIDNPIRLTGVARTRTHLNVFRDSLLNALEVTNVDLPITGSELRNDIPFTMTITLSDSSSWKLWKSATSTP